MEVKKVFLLLYGMLGLICAIIITIIIIKTNFGEFASAKKFTYDFIELLIRKKYQYVYRYVDPAKINMIDLEQARNWVSHYYKGSTYFHPGYNKDYIYGYKPILYDKDSINDNVLEFYVSKKNNQWKVILISYYSR